MVKLVVVVISAASLLMVGGATPWNEVPDHLPPYTCAELQGFTDYGEWAHTWLEHNNFAPNANPVWERKWAAYYRLVRPLIAQACKDAPPQPIPTPDVVIPDISIP